MSGGFSHFVTSRPLRLLPAGAIAGWDLHSLESAVRIVPSTVKLPSYQVKQHWHERYLSDPANMWLRSTVAQLFTE